MEFTVDNLCGFLIRSKLMTPDEMQAMRQRWLGQGKENTGQVPAFLKWLVNNHYVTEYQAALLSRGHADDFFLGHYKLLERIGRGRMAGVYKAIHPSGQIVAIKVLPPSRAKNPQLLARFEREARLAVKLKHPHVVRSFQLGETKTVHYLVMEYLEGETVEEMLTRRKRLPPDEGVRLVYQALLGLQHIHEQSMIHRDLKPANLMLLPAPARSDHETTLKSIIKILDIGLAREFFDENSPDPSPEQMELTGEGVLLGTPDYLAPEQARDPRTIDIRADIYSLGCTLYHLLTGQPPFPDKNILNQMIRHATEVPRPLLEFNKAIPEGLQQIVNWMMAKQPGERYPTPARAAQALQAFMMVTSDGAKPPEETPQLRRYLTWLELESPDRAGASEDQTLPPPPLPVAPPKLIVPANVPAANPPPAKPVAVAAPVADKRVKKRTGVKMPTAAPVAAPPAAAPVMAAPVASPVPMAAAVPAPPAPPSAPAVPKRGGFQVGKRDVLMVGLGVGVMLILYGFCMVVQIVLRWFS